MFGYHYHGFLTWIWHHHHHHQFEIIIMDKMVQNYNFNLFEAKLNCRLFTFLFSYWIVAYIISKSFYRNDIIATVYPVEQCSIELHIKGGEVYEFWNYHNTVIFITNYRSTVDVFHEIIVFAKYMARKGRTQRKALGTALTGVRSTICQNVCELKFHQAGRFSSLSYFFADVCIFCKHLPPRRKAT